MKKDEELLKQKISRLIVPAAFILPFWLMTANLTYDEFWSLIHFAPLDIPQILTDLSLPNNHPLNTLCLKVLKNVSLHPLVLRSGSFICGAFIPLLCGELAYKWSSGNKLAALISAAILAIFSVPVVFFSGIARGYTIQLFFLLLCVWALTLVKENPRQGALWCVVGGAGTMLAVPTGALFLLPAGIGFLIFSAPKERKSPAMWIAAGILAGMAGVFYGINFEALRAGQVWGEEISGCCGLAAFVWSRLTELGLLFAVLATVPAWFYQPKRLFAAGLLLLPLLLAVFSNGGPARTYLYLPAAFAVAGGIGIAEAGGKVKNSPAICAGVAAILGAAGLLMQLSTWRMVDYVEIFNNNSGDLPRNVLPVYRASCGFPIICGAYPQEIQKLDDQLQIGDFRRIACFETVPGEFNGLDEHHSEAVIHSGESGKRSEYGGLSCVIYDVNPAVKVYAGNCYLVQLPGKSNLPEFMSRHGKVLFLNPWLMRSTRLAVWQIEKTPAEIPAGCRIWDIGN